LLKGHKQLRKGRVSICGQIYHVILNIQQEVQPLSFEAQVLLCRLTINESILHKSEILAYVVMPDHVHLLIKLDGEITLSQFVQRYKSFATRFSKDIGLASQGLWQKGFYDRAIRREEDIQSVARYIVANPIRTGLVKSVRQYPFWNAIWL
jgi:REP element-mobilizing transposase RayT